jgi:hypothetical protein
MTTPSNGARPGRFGTYAAVTLAIAALIGVGVVGVHAYSTSPSTTTTVPVIYNNTTQRIIYENYTSWHNGTIYSNTTLTQNYTTEVNQTFWNNETLNHWNNTTLYYNSTVIAPVAWPVTIDGLAAYLVCDNWCPNVTLSVNTTNGAGLDELFGVQANVTNNGNLTYTFEGAGLVSYNQSNVSNTSASPFFLWTTDPVAVAGSSGLHAAETGVGAWPHVPPYSSKLFRLMVEAPEVAGVYDLGIVLYFDAGSG